MRCAATKNKLSYFHSFTNLHYLITAALKWQPMVPVCLITALIELLLLILGRISFRQLEAGLTDVRCKLMLSANKKMMEMPYEMTENPQVLDLQMKARPATADNEKGVAGMVKLYGEVFGLALTRMVSIVILMRRLSSCRFCDKIAVMDGGKVAEYGTHSELLEADGIYAGRFGTQAQYYVNTQ